MAGEIAKVRGYDVGIKVLWGNNCDTVAGNKLITHSTRRRLYIQGARRGLGIHNPVSMCHQFVIGSNPANQAAESLGSLALVYSLVGACL